MAENISGSRLQESVANLEGELSGDLYTEMEEIDISEGNGTLSTPKCEICVLKNPLSESVAVFLCFLCEIYVCVSCMPDHRSHEGLKLGRNESKTEGRREDEIEREIVESDNDRMGDQSERERMLGKVVEELMNESETERTEKFDTSHATIYDRVEVKHKLDKQNCGITGLCGLDNNRWVVCDWGNSCIKIFELGSNVLQRYIRFGTVLWDVTEINLKQNTAELSLVSGSSSHISETDRDERNEQCLIAVTLPWKREIMVIDLDRKPAQRHEIIHTEEPCWAIQFEGDKIFTVCGKGHFDSPFSVYIKSTYGDTLNKFYVDIPGPYLAIVSGQVYLTDWYNDKVQCRNVECQVISEMKIEGSESEGIAVGPDNNVYICAQNHKKIYKLDSDLTRYNSVLDQTTDYMEYPFALCYYRDKLFISHYLPPSGNLVTVVRLQ